MKADAVRGHLDGLILAVVEREPLHGYAIIEALRVRSGGELDMPTGTLYPALRRLEAAGYLQSEWGTAGGRERRTYRLTQAGHKRLKEERRGWRKFAGVIEDVLRPSPATRPG
ncbi:PadR family transcriptional regulator [Allorhizocola rhizosphaerae]|uniref:PadR family transcriptional regulator n=1 Tax=Allorhizocola rhizosphaerae TaxID=1872709 RepID=UPI000E3C1210|nr:helix-turn-helix transcriptional regulator [Allorhizocola rhizosphaerae]